MRTATTDGRADLELAIRATERRAALWRADAAKAAAVGDTIAHMRCHQRAENEARAARMLRQRLTAVSDPATQA